MVRSHRVQRTGRSSLAVTLPKSWTKALNIHVGDPVALRQRGDGTLELNFSGPREGDEASTRRVVVDATGARTGTIGRLLVGAYVSGQDRIVVTNLSPEARRDMSEIDRVVKHLVGTSLVSDSVDQLEYEVYVDPSKYQHLTLHNRLSQMLHMEVDLLRRFLDARDARLLAQLRPIEDEVDRFYYLIVRQVHLASNDYRLARLSGMANHDFQLGCRLVAKMLEVFGDLLSEIGTDLETGWSSIHPPPPEIRTGLSGMLGRLGQLLDSTTTNLTEMRAGAADETLGEIRNAEEEFAALRDRLSKSAREKETTHLVNCVTLRILMSVSMLRVINETCINRSVAPESVANGGFQPVSASASMPPAP